MDIPLLSPEAIRANLVAVALEWQRRYGVAPAITSAISEYDAARLAGHTPESYGFDCTDRTAVSRGSDFCHDGLRYQVKACRPSGKRGSFITKVPKPTNYNWDRLIWILYDREYRVLEAWEWTVGCYKAEFEAIERINPNHMRMGRSLLPAHAA